MRCVACDKQLVKLALSQDLCTECWGIVALLNADIVDRRDHVIELLESAELSLEDLEKYMAFYNISINPDDEEDAQ